MRLLRFIFGATVLLQVGCAGGPVNPSFPITVKEAKQVMREMHDDRKPLERPLLILGGFFDFGLVTMGVKDDVHRAIDDDRVLSVNFFFNNTFDHCREKTIAAVDRAFPSDDPEWTTEADVIAISMGGLIARYAATLPFSDDPSLTRRRLRIHRLFAISTPHRGARLAVLPTFDQRQIDMRAGSHFLEQLDATLASEARYELISYVRLGDFIVGAENASPFGASPWWVANQWLEGAHLRASGDARIVADIIRRLRNEPPLTIEPPAPLPESDPDE